MIPCGVSLGCIFNCADTVTGADSHGAWIVGTLPKTAVDCSTRSLLALAVDVHNVPVARCGRRGVFHGNLNNSRHIRRQRLL
jgi:hypothetical protein